MDLAQDFIRQANSALEGSPYSIATDEASRHRLEEVLKRVSETQRVLSSLPDSDELPAEVRRLLRTREVYESNAIEGTGLSLPETTKILDSYPVDRQPTEEFVKWAVEKAIQQDQRVYEVIGLDAARRLANDFAVDFSRPLSESDLRSLHLIIMGEDPASGRYKRYVNSIEGSDHQTPLPIDTPSHMRELASWLTSLPTRGYRTMGSVIRAAAAHAWLAHIHPFEDGNGRLARLVANIMLSREGMPPLILRSNADRAKYIDALSLSDEAGDLLRLILVFSTSLNRVATQLADPRTAIRLFEQDLDVRSQGVFQYWEKSMQEFTSAFSAELLLHGIRTSIVGGLSPSDFQELTNGKSVSRAWYVELLKGGKSVGMFFYGYPSGKLGTRLEKDQTFPVLMYSAKHPDVLATRPFFVPNRDPRIAFRSFMLEPYERVVYAQDKDGTVRKLPLHDAIKEVAATANSFTLNPADPPKRW